MRLQAGFLDDAEMQARMDADPDEMEGMISATLTYLRGEADTEPMQLADVGALLSAMADAVADGGQRVTFKGPAHLDLRCHPVALRRAVSNLIGNAVSHCGAARLSLAASRAGVVITVDDDGPGIPEAELERVFEPFHCLDASRSRAMGGVGLALTIARQAVAEHGGTLVLSNRAGGSLRAAIDLPASEIDTESHDASAQPH